MNIFIVYCGVCDFFAQASRVEAELKANYPGADITLIKGGGGIFDIKCNGKVIFSKQNIKGQRFPDKGEISGLIGPGND